MNNLSGKYFNKQFTTLVVSAFTVITLVMYASANLSYNHALTSETGQANANQTREQIDSTRQTITAQYIFLNNFVVSIPLLIPIFGFLWFGRILINTGITIGSLAYSYHVSPLTYIVGAYIPIGIIESFAYSLLITESLMLLHAVLRKRLRWRLKTQVWKTLLLYLGLLGAGAILEMAIITSTP